MEKSSMHNLYPVINWQGGNQVWKSRKIDHESAMIIFSASQVVTTDRMEDFAVRSSKHKKIN